MSYYKIKIGEYEESGVLTRQGLEEEITASRKNYARVEELEEAFLAEHQQCVTALGELEDSNDRVQELLDNAKCGVYDDKVRQSLLERDIETILKKGEIMNNIEYTPAKLWGIELPAEFRVRDREYEDWRVEEITSYDPSKPFAFYTSRGQEWKYAAILYKELPTEWSPEATQRMITVYGKLLYTDSRAEATPHATGVGWSVGDGGWFGSEEGYDPTNWEKSHEWNPAYKPAPKYWTCKTAPDNLCIRPKNNLEGTYTPVSVGADGVYNREGIILWKELAEEYVQRDGSPCHE